MITNEQLSAKQIEIEQDAYGRGIERYYKGAQKAMESGRLSELAPSTNIISRVVEHVAPIIDEIIQQQKAQGRETALFTVLSYLDVYQITYLVTRSLINNIGEQANTVANIISESLGAEINFLRFRGGVGPDGRPLRGLADYLLDRVKRESGNAKFQKNQLEAKARFFQVDLMHPRTILTLSHKLMNIVIKHSGVFYRETFNKKVGQKFVSKVIINVTDEVIEYLRSATQELSVLNPVRPPMLIAPVVWTAPIGGGYLTEVQSYPLIKGATQEFIDDAHNNGLLDGIYRTVNYLQSVPFRVNGQVLDVVRWAWRENQKKPNKHGDIKPLGLLPDQDLKEKPIGPWVALGITAEEYKVQDHNGWIIWKKKAEEVHKENTCAERKGKILETHMKLKMAKDYVDQDIYFPYQFDFRGRFYPVTNYLNPQGNDLSKGLLRFSKGIKMTQEGSVWLAVHGATTWANDKIDKKSFDDRYQWVLDNEEMILSIAMDPKRDLRWADADGGKTAWQFLAFCYEWAGWKMMGTEWETTLPCGADGSCNGIQHYSALLRDEVGGKSTNLIPGETPQDIYNEVAIVANQIVEDDIAMGNEVAPLFKGMVDRSLCKRAVMTTPYGVSFYGIKEQLRDDFKDRWDKLDAGVRKDAISYISQVVNTALQDSVTGARIGMKFLQDVAKIANKANLPLIWYTPDGFPVQQRYVKRSSVRVKTTLHDGTDIRFCLSSDLTDVDTRRQTNGIGPNFVHSLDGTHLRMTILKLIENGVSDFVSVHDSYACHCEHYVTMAQSLREAFVELHEVDILGAFIEDMSKIIDEKLLLEIPEMPKFGTLDIRDVLESDYFFA